jgi:hypothetical protein
VIFSALPVNVAPINTLIHEGGHSANKILPNVPRLFKSVRDEGRRTSGCTSNVAGVAGMSGRRETFDLATLQVQRLRTECDTPKADMKRRQSEHGDA